MKKRAVHVLVLAVLFVLGWIIVGWPLIGLFLTLFGSSELAAVATYAVYLVGFFGIYFAYLRRTNYAPWRFEED